ncbi:hypothetical protein ABZ702_06625 [Streptomyces cyaneofuscatus]|uniref:hypothetical protein n=1 Tax=Streptomyces cyaneofuscatus TaxID=66883 RepID=UPI0033D8143E
MDRIQTPTTPAAPAVDVAHTLTTLAHQLLTTPTAHLGHLTVTRTVLDIAGAHVSVTALRPVWEALPPGGHGDNGLTHEAYAARLLLATATDSDPDIDEALRRARAPRTAVTA